jgi:hypothetical protein
MLFVIQPSGCTGWAEMSQISAAKERPLVWRSLLDEVMYQHELYIWNIAGLEKLLIRQKMRWSIFKVNYVLVRGRYDHVLS